MDVTQLYVRTREGSTSWEDIPEALSNFVSEDGYRLTIPLGDYEIVLRRGDECTSWVETVMGQQAFAAHITIKGVHPPIDDVEEIQRLRDQLTTPVVPSL